MLLNGVKTDKCTVTPAVRSLYMKRKCRAGGKIGPEKRVTHHLHYATADHYHCYRGRAAHTGGVPFTAAAAVSKHAVSRGLGRPRAAGKSFFTYIFLFFSLSLPLSLFSPFFFFSPSPTT